MTRLTYLFQKYYEKTATPEERAEFMQLAAEEEYADELRLLMEQAWKRSGPSGLLFTGDPQKDKIFDAMRSKLIFQQILSKAKAEEAGDEPGLEGPWRIATEQGDTAAVRSIFRKRMMTAAAILVAVVGAGWWWKESHPSMHSAPAVASNLRTSVQPPVVPGGNKAVLILGDGSSVDLDSSRGGVLATQGNTRIVQLSGGRIAYNATANKGGDLPKETSPLLYNTIRTPKGGQFQVALPDGSKVWLNAATSLRFPAKFTGKDRTVELNGEAYFEIEPNKDQPFFLKVNNMTVQVLGTHFNVMAYGDENSINTSLLEGAVRVTDGAQARTLRPGQQAQLNTESGKLGVESADMDQVVAWKNGLFQFEGATLETVMHQVSRWYDVDVQYEGRISSHFTGLIPRSASLAQVLHMLDLAGKTKFTLDGRTVVVKPL